MSPIFPRRAATAIALASAVLCGSALAQSLPVVQDEIYVLTPDEGVIVLDAIVLSASEQLRQAPGVSTITAEDIAAAPPARDLSEIVRRMPGVNLTGNSASGARGNQRQIDLRGMGPENTLILIDGKPVLSRNAVRYSAGGERDTRGDSAWVPPELIERVEVLRGPAAARYGSGASGGVVNIVTKRPVEAQYSLGVYYLHPQDDKEGATRRGTFTAAGPLTDRLAYRVSAGLSRADADAIDINGPLENGTYGPAGREGVKSQTYSGLLSWDLDDRHSLDLEGDWSRQGNIYAGDAQYGSLSNPVVQGLYGSETNTMTRTAVSLTHRGSYDFGSSESFIQWENTANRRLAEGMAGSGEGTISTSGEGLRFGEAKLDNVVARTEFDIPLSFGAQQMLTIGAEYRGEFMQNDQSSYSLTPPAGSGWLANPARPTKMDANLFAAYVEDNVYLLNDRLTLTPGLRLDHHSDFGFNASPSLNLSWNIADDLTLKGGVARAFKAPNQFQLNPNYVYNSRGNGCWQRQGPCYILGNPDLDPEISLNKEVGLNYTNDTGWNLGATFFHNDYRNKIATGRDTYATYEVTSVDANGNPVVTTNRLQRWENSGPAVVSGIEGNVAVPLREDLLWSTNFTKMIKSENADGQPLSLIPEHTINTALQWRPTDKLGLTLSATHYGEIDPPTGGGMTGLPVAEGSAALNTRKPYTIANVSLSYDATESVQIVAGVNNLLDKQLERSVNEPANSFNEPGRSFFLGLNTTW